MKSVLIARCKLVVGQDVSEIASAIVRANEVRTRCSPQPEVLVPTEYEVSLQAQVPQPHTPAYN